MQLKSVLIPGIACLFACLPAKAALLAYDSFESYTNGSTLATGSGGTGWTANWSSVSTVTTATPATSLTYSSGAVNVNGGSRTAQVSTTGTTDNVASRAFSTQTGTVYFSFLFRLASGTSDDDFIQFSLNNDTDIVNSGSIGDLSNTTGTNTFSSRIGGSSGGATVQSSISIVQATTYLLVGKISKVSSSNYNRMELFVNPATLNETGVVATQNASAATAAASFFTVRVSNIESSDQYQFDELRIGTEWADVVVSAVPEPSSWAALTGACGLMLAFGKRRRA